MNQTNPTSNAIRHLSVQFPYCVKKLCNPDKNIAQNQAKTVNNIKKRNNGEFNLALCPMKPNLLAVGNYNSTFEIQT